MRIRAATICGVLLILAGGAALIHPQLSFRVEQHSAQVAGQKVLFETRRVIHFPLWFSIPILTIGAALVIVGLQKD
ncbi:MAG: hypothetical protein WA876_14310 [Candidatus Acidiferrales bacterium]